jgi:hypothetical protein
MAKPGLSCNGRENAQITVEALLRKNQALRKNRDDTGRRS